MLISAAAVGVGSAVPVASSRRGARVVAVASPPNHDSC